jgi:hypothetical protein
VEGCTISLASNVICSRSRRVSRNPTVSRSKTNSKTITNQKSTTDVSTPTSIRWSKRGWLRKERKTAGQTSIQLQNAVSGNSKPDVSGNASTWNYNSYRAISLQPHSGQDSRAASKLVPQVRHSNNSIVSVKLGESRFSTRNIETHCGSTTSRHSGHSAQTPPSYSISV